MVEEEGGAARRSSVWQEQPRTGCGIQGCLYGSVVLFAVLLVVMLVIVVMRFGSPF